MLIAPVSKKQLFLFKAPRRIFYNHSFRSVGPSVCMSIKKYKKNFKNDLNKGILWGWKQMMSARLNRPLISSLSILLCQYVGLSTQIIDHTYPELIASHSCFTFKFEVEPEIVKYSHHLPPSYKTQKKKLMVRARLVYQRVILNYFCPNIAASVTTSIIKQKIDGALQTGI